MAGFAGLVWQAGGFERSEGLLPGPRGAAQLFQELPVGSYCRGNSAWRGSQREEGGVLLAVAAVGSVAGELG